MCSNYCLKISSIRTLYSSIITLTQEMCQLTLWLQFLKLRSGQLNKLQPCIFINIKANKLFKRLSAGCKASSCSWLICCTSTKNILIFLSQLLFWLSKVVRLLTICWPIHSSLDFQGALDFRYHQPRNFHSGLLHIPSGQKSCHCDCVYVMQTECKEIVLIAVQMEHKATQSKCNRNFFELLL